MPDDVKTIAWDKFDAGWCPSDDDVNGRPNGLLKMENLELDINGALSLAGGCTDQGGGFTTYHTLWSDDIGGARTDYAGGANGSIYRNNSAIGSGGDSLIMATGVAFKYSLLCSGSIRLKDLGSGSPINLGVGVPILAPTVSPDTTDNTTFVTVTSGVVVQGTVTLAVVGGNLQATFAPIAAETAIVQTNAGNGPKNLNAFLTTGGVGTDEDFIFIIQPNPAGTVDIIQSMQIDFLLVAPGGSGNSVSDYYTTTWVNPANNVANTGVTGLNFNPAVTRGDFTRVGNGTQDWTTVYGVRLTVVFSAAGSLILDFGAIFFNGGSNSSLQGSYEYMQVNVNNTGSYLAKSPMGPINSSAISLNSNYTTITPDTGSGDSQINEIWIFRRGGNLSQWYRVYKQTSSFGTPFNDYMSDLAALALDITYNSNLISVQSLNKIYSIVGPVEGRWFYFTADICYPSDLNDPDLVDPTLGIRIANTNGEVFLCAVKVSDGAIMYGTSHDIYLITGTLTTLPDGTIDVYNRSLGCKHPPISFDASYADGLMYYLGVDGWRSFSPFGQGNNLSTPNTDRLYRKGDSAYGYTGPAAVVPGSTRFPCLVANNKLYCGITGQGRIEVYDLARHSWRVINYGKGDLTAISSTCVGIVTGYFSSDNHQRDFGLKTTSLIDGSTKQTIVALSVVFDDGLPSNRKDLFDVKLRLLTGSGETLAIGIIDEFDNVTAVSATSSTVDTSELLKDDPVLSKTYQIALNGQFSIFELSDIRLDYSPRPTPLTRYYVRPSNFGTPDLKLMAAWPIEIDTLGNTINFTPKFDGVAQSPLSIATTLNRKQTINYLTQNHTYAIDFEGLFTGGPFELYGLLSPIILDKIPAGLAIYQVGPIELFRYGKIKQIQWRAIATGSPIYFEIAINGKVVYSEYLSIAANDQSDARFDIPVPKGIEGQIFRLRIGSPSILKYNYYCRILVSKSGRDTDNEWIDLPVQQQGDQ